METIDVLVVIDGAEAAAFDLAIAAHGRVTQRLPPRLAIVRVAAEDIPAIERIPAVLGAYADVVPDVVVSRLDPAERLFASAWSATRTRQEKRRGDGLAWDAEGFEPPDD